MTFVTFCMASVYFYQQIDSPMIILLTHGLGTLSILIYAQMVLYKVGTSGVSNLLYHYFFIVTDDYLSPENYLNLLLPFWGLALISNAVEIYFLALLSQFMHALFVYFVDQPYIKIMVKEQTVSADNAHCSAGDSNSANSSEGTPDSLSIIKTARDIKSKLFAKIKRTGLGEIVRDQIRSDLYSLQFPLNKEEMLTFCLGQPIIVEFVAVRETMKADDWIGIHGVTHNLYKEITTSGCGENWSYVSGKQTLREENDLETSESLSFHSLSNSTFGTTSLKMIRCPGEPGLRLVKGMLTFKGDLIPWKVGVYEARYHFNGQHTCIVVSRPFEIVPWDNEKLEDSLDDNLILSNGIERGEYLLMKIVECCINIYGSNLELSRSCDFFKFALQNHQVTGYTLDKFEKCCERLVYCIKQSFGVGFSWTIFRSVRSIDKLWKKIEEAKVSISCVDVPEELVLR